MSTLKTHNLQSPDSGSVNITLTQNAGMVVAGISTFTDPKVNGFLTINTNPVGPNYAVSEALRIDNLGGVNDRPFQIFEYLHSGSRYHTIQYNLNTTTNGSAYTYTQGNYGGSSSIEFSNAGHLLFFTNEQVSGGSQSSITPTERFRIASDGQVTFKPDGGITEAIRIAPAVDASSQQEFGIGLAVNSSHTHPASKITFKEYDASDSRGDLLFYTRGANSDSAPTERLRITSAGLVGINHTTSGASTNAPLTIQNSTGSSATRFNLVNSGSSAVESTQIYSQNNDLAFVAGAQEAFRVKDTGQVVFKGGDTSTDAIRVESEAGGAAVHISNFQGVTDTGDTTRLGVGKNDNVLIFTNASGSQISHFAIGNTDSVPLVFSTNNTERFRIAGGGQFGIAGANYGTSGQVLTSGGSSGAPSWSGGARRVLEVVSSPCDGSTIATSNGNVTFQNVTAQQSLSTTFTDVTGSKITYTPPTGTTQVIYEFNFQASRLDALAISHYRMYIAGNEVTYARSEIAGEDVSVRTTIRWIFNIGGSTNNATGRQSSWTSGKEIKLQAEDYGGSYDVQLHETNWWNGAGTDVFAMPTLSLTAIGV